MATLAEKQVQYEAAGRVTHVRVAIKNYARLDMLTSFDC